MPRGGEMAEDVENLYKTLLAEKLPSIRTWALTYSNAFDAVKQAYDNGAWESSTATAFHGELTTKKDNAATTGDDTVAMFETRERNELEKVPEDDWRATFTTYQPSPGGHTPY